MLIWAEIISSFSWFLMYSCTACLFPPTVLNESDGCAVADKHTPCTQLTDQAAESGKKNEAGVRAEPLATCPLFSFLSYPFPSLIHNGFQLPLRIRRIVSSLTVPIFVPSSQQTKSSVCERAEIIKICQICLARHTYTAAYKIAFFRSKLLST